MFSRRWLVTVVCALALAGCGGGGGGGDDGPKITPFSVTLDRSTLTFDVTQGTAVTTQTIVASSTGTPPDPLYLSALLEGEGLEPTIPVVISGSSANIQMRPLPNLAVGDYSGRVLLLACSDLACNNRVGGTPLPVSYTIHVRPPTGLSPSAISLTAVAGEPSSRTVSARFSADATAFTALVVDQPEWLTVSDITSGPTLSSFRVNARGLPAGSYSAVVRASSSTQTFEAPVTLTVTPAPRLDLIAISGQTATGEMTAPLGVSATSYSATVTSGGEWLTITERLPGVVRVSARSLPIGSFHGTITIVTGSSTTAHEVLYTVGAPPGGQHGLEVSPTSLALATVEGATSAAPTALAVTNPSWNPDPEATVIYGAGASGWLGLQRTASGYDVTANAANLIAGAYTATLRLDPGWPMLPVDVPVALTVGIGLARPADVNRVVTASTTLPQLSGSVPVDVVAGVAVGWTATDDAEWLTLTRASGLTGTQLQYTIDRDALGALPNFARHTAHITIAPASPTMTPVEFSLRVDKQVAEITGLGPYYLESNRAQRLIVRGRGFDAVTDVASALAIDGATAANIVRLNDTELTCDLGPLVVGSYGVSIANVLGYETQTRSFKTIDAQSHVYATAQTGGGLRNIFYDDRREAVFAVNVELESLQRFHRVGTTWQVSSIAVPQIVNASLINEGDSVLVTIGDGTLRFIDPETLATQRTFTHPHGFISAIEGYSGRPLPVTNDGRAFLPNGNSNGTGVSYFDSVNGTFGEASTQYYMNYLGGPLYTMARNGERLFIGQSGGSQYPMYYMDARDSELRLNPAGIANYANAYMSDDGSRVLFNSLEVRDGEFGLVGRLEVPLAPEDQLIRALAMSPDGTRAYILVSDPDDFSYDSPPPTPHPQRVYVFDTSTRLDAQELLPVLGYFELPDHPTCRVWYTCRTIVAPTISLDGRTLFFGGSDKLLVVPTDTALQPVSLGTSSGAARSLITTKPAVVRWPRPTKQVR